MVADTQSEKDEAERADDDLQFEFETVGERLAAARQSKEWTLKDVAAHTRVPIRHLQAIEAGDFAALPSRTYAIGFSRAYAQAVGLPDAKVVEDVRRMLGDQGEAVIKPGATQFEIDEPSKVVPARLAWLAALAGAVILIAGFGIWRAYFFPAADVTAMADAADNAAATEAARGSAAASAPAAPVARDAKVVFTAKEDSVWVKFYDGAGNQLFQKQMALGEQYTLPPDAVNPQIWTGRPDALQITIDGKAVPPLGDAEKIIKDVPVSAAALMARAPGAAGVPRSTGTSAAPPATANTTTGSGTGGAAGVPAGSTTGTGTGAGNAAPRTTAPAASTPAPRQRSTQPRGEAPAPARSPAAAPTATPSRDPAPATEPPPATSDGGAASAESAAPGDA